MIDIKDMEQRFYQKFGVSAKIIAAAPGRIEILGNHTDYNKGLVLSMATNLRTYVAVSRAHNDRVDVFSENFELSASFLLNSLSIPEEGESSWVNYIKGAVYELYNIYPQRVFPFNCYILSEIPISSGMSSSAALEIGVVTSLLELFEIKLSKEEIAKLGQRVENRYMGLNSGLLDQFSSIFGEKKSIILMDFRDVKVKDIIKVPDNYSFIVANTMIKHNLVESDYNLRRVACEEAVRGIRKRYPEITSLREVNYKILEDCRDLMTMVQYKRALHIIGENSRVLYGVELLKKGIIDEFGKLLFESHESSKINFENSCKELDYYVELAKSCSECLGARLSGGGFGGISIHLVDNRYENFYIEKLFNSFKLETGIEPSIIPIKAGAGAEVLKGK